MVYIDVHCHSSSKAFMSGIGAEDNNVFDSFYFNIEHPVYRLLRTPIENRSHVRLVSQSNSQVETLLL